ncbi:hypothetical protein EST38_g10597 [Candolleomyces aberdarensis]|uniref:Uncharacterized protein n=1 Tax=Candolleomyces aberdarensis TaxID=2316362 RepID=A0A4V1Q2J0_9AGAR|nr:hypothetical protein EST38_g10597 [Candolleomyces aberdarensis]
MVFEDSSWPWSSIKQEKQELWKTAKSCSGPPTRVKVFVVNAVQPNGKDTKMGVSAKVDIDIKKEEVVDVEMRSDSEVVAEDLGATPPPDCSEPGNLDHNVHSSRVSRSPHVDDGAPTPPPRSLPPPPPPQTVHHVS